MNMNPKTNYRLIDFGEYEKLEQIGDYIIRRPALQAAAKKKAPARIWQKYSALYLPQIRKWKLNTTQDLPDFIFEDISLKLKLSAHGQIGVFPEQMDNWLWLIKKMKNSPRNLQILNGFAYTGAATLAASTPENFVTHLDAASSSVNWAKQNASLSQKEHYNIRWIVDDIRLFLSREHKRGNKYDGFILDPPAFGRSKKGGTWKLERDLPQLMNLVNNLLSPEPRFFVLSCHDKNISKAQLKQLVAGLKNIPASQIEVFELLISSDYGNLMAGKCARWTAQ